MALEAHGRSGGIAAFARTEWRARRRSHLVVAMLALVTVAVAVATFTAAARSRSTFDRLRAQTYASDVVVEVAAGDSTRTVETLRAAEGVIDARAMAEVFVRPAGTDREPYYSITAIGPRRLDSSLVDTPVINEGRAPEPGRPHEVAVSADIARRMDLRPGDPLRLESMTQAWLDAADSGELVEEPDGPAIDVEVTGIARSPAAFGPRAALIHLTPAFIERYEGEMVQDDYVYVRVEPELRGEYKGWERWPLVDAPANTSIFGDAGAADNGLDTFAAALRIVGLVASVAGALAVALALARAGRASRADRTVLVALGWTRSDELRAMALAFAPAIAGGLGLGLGIGLLASPRAMVGLARSVDPAPSSIQVYPGLLLVMGIGAVAVVAFIGLVLALAGARSRSRHPAAARIAGIPIGPPLEVSLGVRHALFAPAARGGRASRGAAAAVGAAVTVALGALIVSSSIERLGTDRSLTGERPERLIDAGLSKETFDTAVSRMEADDRVDVVGVVHTDFARMAGIGPISVLVNDPRRGRLEEPVVEGRMPTVAREAALGPKTAEEAGVEIGGTVRLSGEGGAGDYEVVGIVLFPEGDFTHDTGVAVSIDGGIELFDDPRERSGVLRQILYRWADGVDADAADRELTDDGFIVLTNGERFRRTPGAVTNLAQVEHLPRHLAALVGLLGAATLLHAAWASVVVRPRDLVTLRALGLQRRATSRLAWTHVLVVLAAGLAVGIPLGVAVGRETWRWIAEDAHLVVSPVVSAGRLGVVVAIALLTGAAIAALAGRWVARLNPATTLRAE
jgi:predicted lysophospholipase L1 biosynthesis ABC-type transport system permease subunit